MTRKIKKCYRVYEIKNNFDIGEPNEVRLERTHWDWMEFSTEEEAAKEIETSGLYGIEYTVLSFYQSNYTV